MVIATDPDSDGPAVDRLSGTAGTGEALLRNLVRFGQTLRAAGLPVTVAQLSNVSRALTWIDLSDRRHAFMVMRSLLVTRREDLALFEVVFQRFWRVPGPGRAGQPRRMPRAPRHDTASQGRFTIVNYMAFRARLADEELDIGDRSGTWADVEALRTKRFAEMTPEELDAVGRLIQQMRWNVALRTSRRKRPDTAGRSLDFRRVLRQASRLGALPARLPRRRQVEKERPLVLLADISGSMEKYSRLALLFFHTTLRALPDVETFVFGTRLSHITPQLRLRNIDRAIDAAASEVIDWAGGTRIGACVRTFNREWSRRVLRRGAVVAIISDGCDRGNPRTLRRELRYLQHRCHRLIWLNPHLHHPGYRPVVTGMAAALDFVDDFLPVDDLASLEAFARAIAAIPARGPTPRRPADRTQPGLTVGR